jgi:hypothetical protein
MKSLIAAKADLLTTLELRQAKLNQANAMLELEQRNCQGLRNDKKRLEASVTKLRDENERLRALLSNAKSGDVAHSNIETSQTTADDGRLSQSGITEEVRALQDKQGSLVRRVQQLTEENQVQAREVKLLTATEASLKSELSRHRNADYRSRATIEMLQRELEEVRSKASVTDVTDRLLKQETRLVKEEEDRKRRVREIEDREQKMKAWEEGKEQIVALEAKVIGSKGLDKAKEIELSRARKEGLSEGTKMYRERANNLKLREEELERRIRWFECDPEKVSKACAKAIEQLNLPAHMATKVELEEASREGFLYGYLEANLTRDQIASGRFNPPGRENEKHPFNRGLEVAKQGIPVAMRLSQSPCSLAWDLRKVKVPWSMEDLTKPKVSKADLKEFWEGVVWAKFELGMLQPSTAPANQ